MSLLSYIFDWLVTVVIIVAPLFIESLKVIKFSNEKSDEMTKIFRKR